MIEKFLHKIKIHISCVLLMLCFWFFYTKYTHDVPIKLHNQRVENDFLSLRFPKFVRRSFFCVWTILIFIIFWFPINSSFQLQLYLCHSMIVMHFIEKHWTKLLYGLDFSNILYIDLIWHKVDFLLKNPAVISHLPNLMMWNLPEIYIHS